MRNYLIDLLIYACRNFYWLDNAMVNFLGHLVVCRLSIIHTKRKNVCCSRITPNLGSANYVYEQARLLGTSH